MLQSASQESAVALKAGGVNVYHGLATSGSVIITPPGMMVAMTPTGNETVHGFYRNFVLNSETCLKSLEVVHALGNNNGRAEYFVDIMKHKPPTPPAPAATTGGEQPPP